jgi:hypothetical protein
MNAKLENNDDRKMPWKQVIHSPFYSKKTVTHRWLPWDFSSERIDKLKSGRAIRNTVMEKTVAWIFSKIGYRAFRRMITTMHQ